MRLLHKNKQPIYYAKFIGKTEIKDEYGNSTGSWRLTYSAPVKAMWNVSFVKSDAEVEMFGISAMSTLRIVAPKDGFLLDTASIIWYGKEPEFPFDSTNPKHNYVIAGIRPSLNEVVFYAKRVDVS